MHWLCFLTSDTLRKQTAFCSTIITFLSHYAIHYVVPFSLHNFNVHQKSCGHPRESAEIRSVRRRRGIELTSTSYNFSLLIMTLMRLARADVVRSAVVFDLLQQLKKSSSGDQCYLIRHVHFCGVNENVMFPSENSRLSSMAVRV